MRTLKTQDFKHRGGHPTLFVAVSAGLEAKWEIHDSRTPVMDPLKGTSIWNLWLYPYSRGFLQNSLPDLPVSDDPSAPFSRTEIPGTKPVNARARERVAPILQDVSLLGLMKFFSRKTERNMSNSVQCVYIYMCVCVIYMHIYIQIILMYSSIFPKWFPQDQRSCKPQPMKDNNWENIYQPSIHPYASYHCKIFMLHPNC